MDHATKLEIAHCLFHMNKISNLGRQQTRLWVEPMIIRDLCKNIIELMLLSLRPQYIGELAKGTIP